MLIADDPKDTPSKKRVRFNDEPAETSNKDQLVEELVEPSRRKRQQTSRTLLPGEDEEDVEERRFVRDDRGPIKDVNPDVAATRRAAWRAEDRRRNAIMDVNIPPDVAAAEEGYEEPAEQFLTGNIPVEPFHLRREREEGYFDEEGNYIAYREEEVRDAWLDAVDAQDPELQLNKALATVLLARHKDKQAAASAAHKARRAEQRAATGKQGNKKARTSAGAGDRGAVGGAAAGQGKQEEEEEGEGEEEEDGEGAEGEEDEEEGYGGQVLTEEEAATVKSRMAALLLPGECALDALRRLGTPAHPESSQAAGSGGRGKGRGKSEKEGDEEEHRPLGHTAERQRARKLKRLQEQQQQQQEQGQGREQGPTQPGLQQQGDNNGHQVAPAAATAPGSAAENARAAGGVHNQSPAKPGASAGTPGVGAGPSSTAGAAKASQSPGTKGVPASAGEGGAGQHVQHHRGAGTGSLPVENSVAFNKLAELTDRLLSSGDFNAYSKPRELLVREAAAVSGAGAAPGSPPQQQSSAARAVSQQEAASRQGAGPGRNAGEEGKGHEGHRSTSSTAADVAGTTEGQPAATDADKPQSDAAAAAPAQVLRDDEDMFGDDFSTAAYAELRGSSRPKAALPPVWSGASEVPGAAAAASGATDAARPAATSAVDNNSGATAMETEQTPVTDSATAGQPGAASTTAAVGPKAGAREGGTEGGGSDADVLTGFELDSSTGLLYSTTLGLYYDAASGCYMDASTGSWYRITAGQYELVEGRHGFQSQAQQQPAQALDMTGSTPQQLTA